MKRARAFTLIELLVVIGVIVILIAIMLPALSRAKQQARTTVCLTHLRGLGQAMNIYVQEWNVRSGLWGTLQDLSAIYPGGGALSYTYEWDYQFLGAGMDQTLWGVNNGARNESDKLRFCPETADPGPGPPAVGRSHLEWRDLLQYPGLATVAHNHTGSYGINGWLYQSAPWSQPGRGSNEYRWGQAQQKSGAVIPAFADCNGPELAPFSSDQAPADLENPFQGRVSVLGGTALSRGELSSACLDRHRRAVNVAFFDAHAEYVKLPDLWTLKWTANWDRSKPEVVPGPGK